MRMRSLSKLSFSGYSGGIACLESKFFTFQTRGWNFLTLRQAMPDDAYRNLVSDTVRFIKEHFAPQKVMLTSPENGAFFEKSAPLPPSPPPHSAPVIDFPPLSTGRKALNTASPALKPTPPPNKPPPDLHKIEKNRGEAPKERAPVQAPNEEWGRLLQRLAPHLALSDEIPPDAGAQKRANQWKEKAQAAPVAILSFGEKGQERVFLDSLASAIAQKLAPSAVIDAARLEREQNWEIFLEIDILKLILAPADFQKRPQLMRHYKEFPSTSQLYLGKVPLLVLSPVSAYLNNPSLKRTLWETLCQLLTPPSS